MNRVNTDDIEFTNDYTYLWQGVLFTGIGFELGQDGTLISEMEFSDGIQFGKTRTYHPNGLVNVETDIKYGVCDGFVREWDVTGILVCEEEFEKGICLKRKEREWKGELVQTYELTEADPQYEMLLLFRKCKFST